MNAVIGVPPPTPRIIFACDPPATAVERLDMEMELFARNPASNANQFAFGGFTGILPPGTVYTVARVIKGWHGGGNEWFTVELLFQSATR
jgi:hypothetical protein